MVYTVSGYLKKLTLAKRTARTTQLYRERLGYFADFLGVPTNELHNHLTKENLINYAEHIQDLAPSTRQMVLSIVLRYYKINKVTDFDELETAILKPRNYDEPDDKPLTLDILRLMMDIANPRERAVITMLISTGMRAGELCAIRPDDIDSDTVHIRPEVTNQRGRTVYLTSEAREAIDVWLTLREDYMRQTDNKYYSRGRTGKDMRLFCSSYSGMKKTWLKLFNRVDGERGKYHAKCTMHSCRKYFRTYAVRTMDLDLVEMLMGHEGYLTKAYRRIPPEEARAKFHEGEHSLYINQPSKRVQEREIEEIRKEQTERIAAQDATIATLEYKLAQVEQVQTDEGRLFEVFKKFMAARGATDTHE
ncbi:MAG: site-specific integrase [Methanoregula sp.]|uniref:tyrosine-type recombinase/integrase n=1 Tax=Methanoregula sp. TaxID=2052170 RepID=UPI003C22FD37